MQPATDMALTPSSSSAPLARAAADGSVADRRPAPDGLVAGDVVLGRYALERFVGRGGAGSVWCAEDRQLGRRVAVKSMPVAASERTLAEGRAGARVSHPAIVAVYGMGEAEGRAWLVQELVEGPTLRRAIVEDTHDDGELLRIGHDLCRALRHAHRCGVVHRDVTPRNVLIPADPGTGATAKLADFGIATLDGADERTAAGRVVGTLAYMAPERLRGGQGDESGDLWALGVVLHEALTGEHPAGSPRPGRTASELLPIHEDLPSLAPRRPDLEPDLVAAIDRACAGDPAERGTIDDLAAVLDRHAPAAASALSRAPRADERDATRDAGRPPLLVLAGPCAATAAALPLVGVAVGVVLVFAAVAAAGAVPEARRRVLAGVALLGSCGLAWGVVGLVVPATGVAPLALPGVAWLVSLVAVSAAFPRRVSGRPSSEGSLVVGGPSRSIR